MAPTGISGGTPELQQLQRQRGFLGEPQNYSNPGAYGAVGAYRLGGLALAPNPNPNPSPSLNKARNILIILSKGGCAPPCTPLLRDGCWARFIVYEHYLNVLFK